MNPLERFSYINRALCAPVGPHERLVLIALIQRVRVRGAKRGLAWPTAIQLAEAVGSSERNVRRSLVRLEEEGLIQRWRRPNNYDYRVPPLWDEVG